MAAYSDVSMISGLRRGLRLDVPGLAVTADIFEVLGTQPFLGRGFSRAEEKRDGPRVVVLSYSFWQRLSPAISVLLGKTFWLPGILQLSSG